jgi:uncharacterized NAD(P)/FAD-binding protein YdhS
VRPDFPAAGFASRCHYGEYLGHVLDTTAAAGGARLRHIRSRVVDLRPHRGRLRIRLADRTPCSVDAVVLAFGHAKPSTSWAPSAVRRSPVFVADPWAPAGRIPRPIAGDDVVLVGTGLTAIDMAMQWSAPGVRVHLVSRHGMLPLPHADRTPCFPIELPRGTLELRRVERLVFDAIRSAGGDWRRVVDGLRPVTNDVWRRLPDPDRRRFLATGVRRWDRVRHRVAPEVYDWLEQRRRDGSLVVHPGGVVAADPIGQRIRLELGDGASVVAAAVVNCTGPDGRLAASSDPFHRRVLSSGSGRTGPLGLGLATEDDGRVRPRRGNPLTVWTIGPPRRGELWETTAIPEIRAQAVELAAAIVRTFGGDPGDVVRPAGSYLPRAGGSIDADVLVP